MSGYYLKVKNYKGEVIKEKEIDAKDDAHATKKAAAFLRETTQEFGGAYSVTVLKYVVEIANDDKS